ncbi:hypothetical protein JCM12298_19130 [Desulfothermus naphthae]
MVSIIIVAYHNENTIEACLRSICKHASKPWEIIIVDNSLDNLTSKKVKNFLKNNPGIALKLVVPKRNVGFAKGCNIGARHAKGNFLMFLNPDTELINDVPGILSNFLLNNLRACVAGPMILDEHGKITKTCRNLPNWYRIFLDACGLDRILGQYKLLHFDHKIPRNVEQVVGACFFVSHKDFIKFGGFDESFFMYFEEVDFCKRVLDANREVWFRPEAKVKHIGGVSAESPSNIDVMIKTLRNSRNIYFKKHFGIFDQILVDLINRLEGLGKGCIFAFLYIFTKRIIFKKKAQGFFRAVF